MSASRCPYHHGNLRNALIIAAAELIERDGTLDFRLLKPLQWSVSVPRRLIGTLPTRKTCWVRCDTLPSSDLHCGRKTAAAPRGSIEGILGHGPLYLKYAREKRVFFSLMWEARADIDERRRKSGNGAWWL